MQAIDHVNAHGSGHSEAIVTADTASARAFQLGVDAACVYVNASTRFTDGGEFGMGAEIGNSTQKLHARGPIGLRELCTFKYLVEGDGPGPRLSALAIALRIGILGGTFNPPHLGHLVCAQEAHRELALDQVMLIPAGTPPHKPVESEPAPSTGSSYAGSRSETTSASPCPTSSCAATARPTRSIPWIYCMRTSVQTSCF